MSAAHNRENTTGVHGTCYGIGNRPPSVIHRIAVRSVRMAMTDPFVFRVIKHLWKEREKGM